MNDVEELKQFATVHARAQEMRPAYVRQVLDHIDGDEDGVPGSWAREWCEAGERLESRGRLLEACRHYTMARFPYVAGTARKQAYERCLDVFDRWQRGEDGVTRVEVEVDGYRVGCWASGLSTRRPLPLLLVTGGIVSIKEQWAPTLRQARKLGMACVVTEMPGVGENTLPYTPDGHRMLSRVIDAIGDRADTEHTYALALSFSGHMALRASVDDRRIKGIVTTGAPVSVFFTDPAWRSRVPRITIDTLAHLTGIGTERHAACLPAWALTDEQLSAVAVPVRYIASLRDEIIPAGDVRRLRDHVADLRVLENDDVHASPAHITDTSLWTARSLLRMRNAGGPQAAIIGGILGLVRARRRLSSARA